MKGGTLWDFSTSILSQNSEKIEGAPFWDNFFPEKNVMSHNSEKTQRWYPSVSPGIVCYAEKRKNYFDSVRYVQMVQFDTIKFCRT